MKVLINTQRKTSKDGNRKNVAHLEITGVAIVHCSIVNNVYQQGWRVLDTFVHEKLFCQLLDVSSEDLSFRKTFDADFSYIEVWFTNKNYQPLKLKDKMNIKLVNT